MKRQFQAYEALSKKENEIRRIRHDLANHLQVIKGVENKEKENLSQQYQKNLKEIFENISLIRESEPREDLTVDTKKFSSSTAWWLFTIFLVNILMVIIVSQLVLSKVFTYESILIMEFFLVSFLILHIWNTLRRTRKENEQLTQRIHDTMDSPDITRTLNYIDDIINNLETLSVQEEENALEQLDRTESLHP